MHFKTHTWELTFVSVRQVTTLPSFYFSSGKNRYVSYRPQNSNTTNVGQFPENSSCSFSRTAVDVLQFLTDFYFTHDVALLDVTINGLQDMLDDVSDASKQNGFTKSSSKTKVMTLNHLASCKIISDGMQVPCIYSSITW